MNRRIYCSLALPLLLCVYSSVKTQAQEVLPQQAADNGTALSVVQWVKPKTAGVLKGDVYAPVPGGASVVVDDAVIVLRGKGGWVGKGETNRLGRFTVTDVAPGVYSMMVKAPGLFAFYAIHVAAENDVDVHQYPERLTVSCALIAETAVNRIAKHSKGELSLEDVVVAPEGLGVAQGGTRPSGFVVTLNDGEFSGVLRQAGTDFLPAVGEEITLLQDGLRVATGVTDKDGRFTISELKPGIYAFVSRGKSGVAVVGIEARAALDGQANAGTSSESRFVSLLPLQQESASFNLQVAPNTLSLEDEQTPEPERSQLAAGVGGGGGGGGGGAAAAILAAAAAGAAINDGGGGTAASPAVE